MDKYISKRMVEIEERCRAATEGPWKVIDRGNTVPSSAVVTAACDGMPQVTICPNMSPKTGNAQFIAHAREDIPWLLKQIVEKDFEIKQLREASQWIPVTERLPEVGQRVLVWNGAFVPTHVVTYDILSKNPQERWFYEDGYDSSDCWIDNVTFWMPLLDTPKESDKK